MRHQHHTPYNRVQRGFSLVELSIVLVILGLLTGGILAGKSLIRASEIRSVGTEYQRYATATHAFREKYFYLPGDLLNAQSIWGIAGTCPGTNATSSTDKTTCNGDGDGLIKRTTATSNEIYRYWQHLANAGFIEGQYNGVADSTTASDSISLIGTNVPASRLNSAGWTVYYLGYRDDVAFFESDYGNMLYFGASSAGSMTQSNILTPAEAWNIDTKIDDGLPNKGKVLTKESASGANSCHDATFTSTAHMPATANYLLTNDSIACMLLWKL